MRAVLFWHQYSITRSEWSIETLGHWQSTVFHLNAFDQQIVECRVPVGHHGHNCHVALLRGSALFEKGGKRAEEVLSLGSSQSRDSYGEVPWKDQERAPRWNNEQTRQRPRAHVNARSFFVSASSLPHHIYQCVCARARARVCVCVCACVRACVRV